MKTRNLLALCRSLYKAGAKSCFVVAILVAAFLPVLESRANILSWSGGGGTDTSWNNSANWGFVGAPGNGDTLIFSAAQPNLLNTNNIAGLTLSQIRFVGTGGGYDIRGNAFTLTNNIEATNSAGANIIENNIAFGSTNEIVDVTSTFTLGGVLSGTPGLVKNGPGILTLNGPLSNVYGGTTTVNQGSVLLQKAGFPLSANAIPGNLVIGGGSVAATVENIYGLEIADNANITIGKNGLWDLNSQTETIGTNLTLVTGGQVTMESGSLTLTAPSTINSSGSFNYIYNPGTLNLGAGPCTINVSNFALNVYATVTGSASITKIGQGDVDFYGTNTYTGQTTVSEGWFFAQSSFALGSSAGGAVVNSGATLALQNGITISNESLTISGVGEPTWAALDAEGGAVNTWAGPVTMTADTTFGDYGGGTLRVLGTITGTGSLIEVGGGTVSLEGTNANTYTGDTVVSEGTLTLGKIGTVGTVYAIPNSLILSNNTTARLIQPWQIYSPIRLPGQMTILNTNSVFDLNGLTEWLPHIVMNSAQITTGPGLLYLTGDITVLSGSTTNSAINGNVQLYGFGGVTQDVLTNTGHMFSPDLVLNANISSSGTMTLLKDGPGEVDLRGTNNTYTGATIINNGSVWMDNTNSLGNTNQPVTVNNGGSLYIEGSFNTGLKPLVLNGPGYGFAALTSFGNSTWGGPITLASTASVGTYNGGQNFILSGAISGPGGLNTTLSGAVTLSGPVANSYAGLTTVSSGALQLNKPGFITALPGNVDVFGTLLLQNADQISHTADVSLEGGSLFNFGTFFAAFDTLHGSGNVFFGVNGYVTLGGNNGTSTYNGIMSGGGYAAGYTVEKQGTGTFTMAGNNTFTNGLTRANGGTFIINGNEPQIPTLVDAGATLGGRGTVGNISSIGTISPGVGAGILTCSNVVMNSGSSFTVELTGPSPGIGGYDELNARGTVNLTSASTVLTVIPAFTTAVGVGQTFAIINNDKLDAITGTFVGLPEGSVINTNGYSFSISYVGGSGNDVLLTLTNVPGAFANSTLTLGNGTGFIDPNECNYLSVSFSNKLGTAMTGVTATLASATPNVAVTQPLSAYPDAPGNGLSTNTVPFQISTFTNFACGTTITLNLNVTTAGQGTFSVPVVLQTGAPAAVPSRFDNSTVTSIPDVGSVDSSTTVSGFSGTLAKVTVELYLTHTFDSDLTNISLVAPDGTTVMLSSANGGSGQGYGINCSPDSSRTTFDDAAGTSITAGVAPFTGTFRPQSPLSAFAGNGTPNGTWKLHVADGFGGSLGTLRCWSLNLYNTTCSPGGGLCDLCPNVVLTGATGPGSVQQSNFVNNNNIPSTCGTPKTCPGTAAGGPFPSDNYVFHNGPSSACVTVTLEDDSTSSQQMLSAAYLGSFDITNVDKCTNYLGDCGFVVSSLNPIQSYSFNVASNATFVVNIIASSSAVVNPYKLTVSGGDCRPVLNITPTAGKTVQLDWTTAAAGYSLESTNMLGGAGTNWSSVTNIPVVINSRFTLTNSPATNSQFFRLRKQ